MTTDNVTPWLLVAVVLLLAANALLLALQAGGAL
jgi:hypothetical protein